MSSFIGLTISTGFIVLSCVLASLARKLTNRFFKVGLVQELFFESIAAAELCATCFELIIVADNYGVATYAIYLFLLTIWWSNVWDNASACPYTHMEDMIEGKTSPRIVVLKTWAQLMGGCLVWRYVQVYWWLETTELHKGRATEDCSADLQVHPYFGAAIECLATLLCRLASKSITKLGPKHSTIIDSFIGTTLVVAAFNYSGGYFNPVLATALKWGCAGHTGLEHFIVYWIGACIGAIMSVPIFNIKLVKQFLVGENDVIDLKDKNE